MKKRILLIALVACLVIGCICLVACGNGGNDESSSSEPTNTSDTTTTTTTTTTKEADPESEPEPEKKVDVAFLLVGQSNAGGRGVISSKYAIDNDKTFMWRDGKWVNLVEPISLEKDKKAGACLATSFLDAYAEEFGTEVGVIEATKGGTSIANNWKPGKDCYKAAIKAAKAAQESGTKIIGILWHQGESDYKNTNYAEDCYNLLSRMITDLSLDPNTPVIVGEVCENYSAAGKLNPQINELADSHENFACATSMGLEDEPSVDKYLGASSPTHFNTPSLRLLGLRYFAAYYELATGNSYTYIDDLSYYSDASSDYYKK